MKWYMVRCDQCGKSFPFTSEAQRDEWLRAHSRDSSHKVKIYEEAE